MKGTLFLICAFLWQATQRNPAPPPPRPPDVKQHLADLRHKLKSEKAVNVSAQRALQYASRYLAEAGTAFHDGFETLAERLAAAADCFLHVAEHQTHLMAGGGPKGPPPPAEIQGHLQRVYFRIQQSEYFLAHSHDYLAAAQLPDWARGFYQVALRAFDRKEWVAADENGKCAEEIVKALENLAQAAGVAESPRLGPQLLHRRPNTHPYDVAPPSS